MLYARDTRLNELVRDYIIVSGGRLIHRIDEGVWMVSMAVEP